jgi:hypothetical protein
MVSLDILEGPNTDTFTQDTTNSFQNTTGDGSSGGSADTNITLKAGFRPNQSTITSQTHRASNGTARDWASMLVAFPEVPISSGTVGGLKIGWSVPSGGTMLWGEDGKWGADAALLTASDTYTRSITTAGQQGVRLEGWYYGGASAGTVKMRIAQNSANGSTTRNAYSSLQMTRVAGPVQPPTPRVPFGLYSGTLAELQARETLLGITNLPTWQFFALNTAAVPVGFDTGRLLIFNIHSRIGNSQVLWNAVAAGTYDSQLITLLTSIGSLTQSTIYLSVQEEMDGVAAQANATTTSQPTAKNEYIAFADHIKSLAATYAPRAICGQVVADASRLATWLWPSAQWYAFDPHVYHWATSSFATKVSDGYGYMVSAGVGSSPFMVHTGAVENPLNTSDKADWITAMGTVVATGANTYPNWILTTYWDRTGVVNGSTANEQIDSSPQALAAIKTCLS